MNKNFKRGLVGLVAGLGILYSGYQIRDFLKHNPEAVQSIRHHFFPERRGVFYVVHDNDLSRALNESGKAIVIFSESWCKPCKIYQQEIQEKVAKGHQELHFYYVDTAENKQLLMQYGLRGWPTTLILKNGQTVEQFQGYEPGILEKKLKND